MLTKSSKILFLQHNVNGCSHYMHTCLDYGIEYKLDFILFQHPFIGRDNITISHSAYYCIMPDTELRPRVMIFARKQSRFDFCLRSDLISDNDCMIIDITDKTKKYSETIQLINIYNEKSLQENSNKYTIQRLLNQIIPHKNTIFCGDLNAHHSWWNSSVSNANIRTKELVKWLEKYEFELLNKPDQQTCTRSDISVIDLAFITKNLNQLYTEWEISDQLVTGSDHEAILFMINIDNKNLVENPLYNNQYNFDKADWNGFKDDLLLYEKEEFHSQIDNSEISTSLLESEAQKLRDLILKAAEKNIPKKRITERSKPWWNNDLKTLRKELATAKRRWKRKQTDQKQYQEIRSDYLQKIKLAKANCWNKFLENAEGKDIFKAFQYTKPRRIEKLPILQNQDKTAITFEQKCETFMTVLFSKPPQSETVRWDNYTENLDWKWPEVKKDEIKTAIFTSSIKKAAGPDQISFLIIQKAFEAIEERFIKLFNRLIFFGYHPVCWREAIGVILKKPNRNASLPKSYRVISLLNCLGKIAEKIIATRLAFLAGTTNILNFDQMGGRKQTSAIDAVMSLIHDIQLAKNENKITSVLFLDIKGAFDHVSANKLLKICQELGLPRSLCRWIECFLNNRYIQLAFDGEKQDKTRIEIGIPQGSPVSPILFLIYIRNLFSSIENMKIRSPSYLDDIGLVVSSDSLEENCFLLKRAAERLIQLQTDNMI